MMVKKVFVHVVVFFIWFSFFSFGFAQEVAKLLLTSDQQQYLIDSEFIVELKIEGVQKLFGYSIDINYQQNQMDLIKLEEGDFFSSRGMETIFQQKNDVKAGTIQLASAIPGKSYHASGSGVLARIHFKAKFEGNASVQFTKVILKDPDLNDMPSSSQNLQLNFYAEKNDPILSVEPTLLDFGSVEFGAQPEKSFQVKNIGKGEIRGEAVSLNPWIRVRPQQFTEDTEFSVVLLTHTIAPGTSYTGEIKIRSNGGEKSVVVKLSLFQDIQRDPPPLIILTPDNNIVTRESRLFILCETHPEAFASINQQRLAVDSEDGIFFLNTTLKEGLNSFVVSVWDAWDNKRSETINVTRKTIPPQITVSEVPLFVKEEEIQVQGKTEANATLFFNRQPVQLAKDGSFSVSYKIINEMNQLVFTAVDELGNARTVVRVFFHRPAQPNAIILTVGSNSATFNGRSFLVDAPPILVQGRVMVPIRVIAEIFGAEIDWKADSKTVTIALRWDQIVLVVGNKQATVNGKAIALDAAPLIDQGRLMVPIRFISEVFKAKVEWDQELKQVTIRF
ncbi:MAG TPA: stalk domain-containing protein [Caldisericia bacterium]|nr:stalk domain-containing protein [Caldisericia bacterium]